MPRAAIASPSSDLAGHAFERAPKPTLSTRFGRSQRLTRPDQFDAALKARPRVRSGRFALHARPHECWRLGLVVPKRYEPLAVRRNTIKRIWREAFRSHRGAFSQCVVSYDLVVRLLARSKPLPLPEFRRTCREEAVILLSELLDRLDRIPVTSPCATSSSS